MTETILTGVVIIAFIQLYIVWMLEDTVKRDKTKRDNEKSRTKYRESKK